MDDVEVRHLPGDLPQLFDGGDPAGDAGRTLSVPLPGGDLVWPDPGYPQRQLLMRPAFWLSDEPVSGELWTRVRAEHGRSGLWPLLMDETDQPWAAGQIAPEPVAEVANYHPHAFMYEVWADWADQAADEDHGDLAPFGRHCPGPAPAGVQVDDAGAMSDRHARALAARGMSLGLVPVDRGADVLAAVGWQGALNHNEWTAPLSAVLRSWEERFGARVVGLGFNTLELSVAAPPVTTRHAVHVAAEHWAFCPDILFQGPGTLAGYAEEIRAKTNWSFWWD
ncbi:DUF4253 domain-containing protein [Actinomadura darangshiensis]|uniref:DUF4253 domain-containing protein n=1 Tax=Actinomadura darangshiensis TaxID=705336 RepID=A0A4R5BCI1_9ACTN|nr:DUF4253 domain-containing protein [Actinomadura darangshiensis]TDD82963.1 DUF4253 domain-containing protein [Actinomadura darangshiensis]